MADTKMRKIEIWDPPGAEWVEVQFKDLRKGHVFRMFEPDNDDPVVDKSPPGEVEGPVSAWVCVDNAFPQDPPAQFGVKTVPVPGF
jgi:hypothetical protein